MNILLRLLSAITVFGGVGWLGWGAYFMFAAMLMLATRKDSRGPATQIFIGGLCAIIGGLSLMMGGFVALSLSLDLANPTVTNQGMLIGWGVGIVGVLVGIWLKKRGESLSTR